MLAYYLNLSCQKEILRLSSSFLLRQDEPGAIDYKKAAPGHEFF